MKLSPPPATGIGLLDRWLGLLWRKLTGDAQIEWAQIDTTGTADIDGNLTVAGTSTLTGNVTATANLTVNGNTTLGNATTDTITLTGTVQPGVVIEGSSSGAAMRITQTGSGGAIVVEDSTTPDSTPFSVDATGTVLIGTSTAGTDAAKLDIVNVSRKAITISDVTNDATTKVGIITCRHYTNSEEGVGIIRGLCNSTDSYVMFGGGDNAVNAAKLIQFYTAADTTTLTGTVTLTLSQSSGIAMEKTITAAGTTGAQTINKNAGSVNFAAAAASLVVTDSRVTANSVILATVATNDATMKSAAAVPAAGSFTLYPNAAPTAETRVNFLVIN